MYVVFNIESLKAHKSTQSESAAKRMVTVLNKKVRNRLGNMNLPHDSIKWAYTTSEAYEALDIEVETYDMLDPLRKPIRIRKSLKGTACDPATEAYHST